MQFCMFIKANSNNQQTNTDACIQHHFLMSNGFLGCLDAQLLLEKLQQSAGLVHLLDLKHSDIRMDLVKTLRNEGVKYFIVDVGSNLLHNFFDQAMKSGIVHAKMSFLSSSLVCNSCYVARIS